MNIKERPLSTLELRPLPEVVDFAEIRNPLGASPLLIACAKEKPGVTEERLTRELGDLWHITPDMIVIGHGSTDLIDQIPALFLQTTSLAVLPVPTYFGLLDKVPEDSVIQLPLSREDGFAPTTEHLQRLLEAIRQRRPGLVWLCSPNNPTGLTIPLWHTELIAETTTDGLVVIDEAYQELVDPLNKQSAIQLIRSHPNILVTRTFSKAYGLPEIHVGVAIGTPEIIGKLRAARTKTVEQDSLIKASVALADQPHIWKSHFLMAEETEWVWKEVHQMEHVEMGARSTSGVCIVRHRTKNLWPELLAAGIKTTDFNGHRGLQGQRFVRLGLLDHEHNIKLIKALRQCDRP